MNIKDIKIERLELIVEKNIDTNTKYNDMKYYFYRHNKQNGERINHYFKSGINEETRYKN